MRGSVVSRALAAVILTLLTTPLVHADIITMPDIARGIVMTQAQCAAIPQAVWINAMGRGLCMRYYLSTAGGEGARPVVFLQGDLGFDIDPKTGAWSVPATLKDTNTDDLVVYADLISKRKNDRDLPRPHGTRRLVRVAQRSSHGAGGAGYERRFGCDQTAL